jgi:hydrogenase maturation protein HypF
VQGVGFRPMVYHLAKQVGVTGYVKNANDGIHIYINAKEKTARLFLSNIKQQLPPHAKIISSHLEKTTDIDFDDFSIRVEDDESEKNVIISPDKAICENCRNEMHDASNRRFRYPFITCTQCGPRYSIMQQLPFERHTTSMQKFIMCHSCQKEYADIGDRRFFSQTNSCSECGIRLGMHGKDLSALPDNSEDILHYINIFLHQGKIIALKGIGGYLLFCSAENVQVIQILRSRKHRPSKPFALLFPDLNSVRNNFQLNDNEKALLQSAESPIILLSPKQSGFSSLALKHVAPGLRRLGVMLPYAPLLELIVRDFGKPLIATSANISGSPIIYKDEEALAWLFDIADYVVTYNRDIIIPEDDSVVQFTRYFNQQIVLRRSRGYAPSFLHYKPQSKKSVLATGAFLKSSFTASVNGNVFISQFLGSSETYESQQMYKDTLNHWFQLYTFKPELIIADTHRGYFSHQYAIELSEKYGSEVKFIQHHEAHFAAVLGENNLLQMDERILGVVWDGTGLGSDGNIWGGEFFSYENNEMYRYCHFDYFPVIGGDKLAKEPRIAALCVLRDVPVKTYNLKEKFTEIEWNNYQSLTLSTQLRTSSVGRIFDAVASLLDLCDRQTYEGEAAMHLQSLAEEYVEQYGFTVNNSYFEAITISGKIDTALLFRGIINDRNTQRSRSFIAAKFHFSMVHLIGMVAKNIDAKKICFSGGVFQNALLVDWILREYKNKYQLYFHKNLSPNDENISFGQMVYCDNNIVSSAVPTTHNFNVSKSEIIINF